MGINWNNKSYSKTDFAKAWQSSITIAEVARKLGYSQGGGNYQTLRRAAKELDLTSDHILGKGHSKGKSFPERKRPLNDLLVKNSNPSGLKNKLFSEGVFEKKCYKCEITEWNGQPAPLELEHIDGDNRNNELSNLTILCPNCHAQTDTYKGKNIKKRANIQPKKESKPKVKSHNKCSDCNKNIGHKSIRCSYCSKKAMQKIAWPEISVLKSMVSSSNYTQVAKILGVSDNAIRKHIKSRDK